MKKRTLLAMALAASLLSTVPVYASLEQVNNFLSTYSSSENTFYTEEFTNSSIDNKTLFIRMAISANDPSNLVFEERNILAELAHQDWFDYNSIYCVSFGSDSSYFISLNEYNIDTGICSIQGLSLKYPWLIKSQDELSSNTKKFLGRITQELLQLNIDNGINLNIGAGGEDNLSISESGGAALVSGECQYNNTSYCFVVEFTYKMTDEWNGTYETIYIGINDIDLYGKYTELTNIILD